MAVSSKIRIGTRKSPLAEWQAEQVRQQLHHQGNNSILVFIESEGDADLKKPLYQIGSIGVFTAALDKALIENEIDVAVHSCKDLPTELEPQLQISATLPRGDYRDVLIPNGPTEFLQSRQSIATVASGSIRRRAQWLNRYPNHLLENLRGNVGTRLEKLSQSNWHGAIFAKAGLDRLGILPEGAVVLDWMIPAPAQGVVAVVSRKNYEKLNLSLQSINDENTMLRAQAERAFLNRLEGGCSAPIGAMATIESNVLSLRGVLLDETGSKLIHCELQDRIGNHLEIATQAADDILARGGTEIMNEIKRNAAAN